MNVLLKILCISLLSITSLLGNAANGSDREASRAAQQQQRAAEGGDNPAGRSMNHEQQRRSQENSGQSVQGNNPAANAPDNSRKQGRLTPEERRDLRRQINEAGQDIYLRKP